MLEILSRVRQSEGEFLAALLFAQNYIACRAHMVIAVILAISAPVFSDAFYSEMRRDIARGKRNRREKLSRVDDTSTDESRRMMTR